MIDFHRTSRRSRYTDNGDSATPDRNPNRNHPARSHGTWVAVAIGGSAVVGAGASMYASNRAAGAAAANAPAPRNLAQELGTIGQSLPGVAAAGSMAYGQSAPAYAAANQNAFNQTMRGNFDPQAHDSANPGFLAEYNRLQGAGELSGWTPEQFARAYAGNNESALANSYTGGIATSARQNYDAANPQQTAYNATLASELGRLNGQTVPGMQTNTASFTGSAGRPDIIAQQAPGRTGVQTNTAGFTPMSAAPSISAAQAAYNAAQAVGPVQTQIAAVNSAAGSAGVNTAGTQHTAATAGPLVSAARFDTSQANGGPLLGALQTQALGAIRNQGSPLQATMQSQAQGLLNANGALTAGELANTQDATRAAYAGRGMLRSNRGIGAEILNTDQAQRARLLQNLQIGQSVDAAGQQQLGASRQFALAAQGQGQNLSTFNAAAANTNLLDSARRSDAASLYNSGMLTQNSQFNSAGLNAMNQSSAERADTNNRFNYTGEQANRQFNTAEQNRMAQAAAQQQAAEARANADREAQNNQFNIAQQNAMAMEAARRADEAARFNATNSADANRFNASGVNAVNQSAAERADANARFNLGTLTQTDQFNATAANDASRFNTTTGLQNDQFNVAGINAMNTDAATRADGNARFNASLAVGQNNDSWGRSMQLGQVYGSQAINPNELGLRLSQGAPDYMGAVLGYGNDVANTNYNGAASRANSAANNSAALMGAGINTLGTIAGSALTYNRNPPGGGYNPSGSLGTYGVGTSGICWVARAVYGANAPQWHRFRGWLLTQAKPELLAAYLARGPRLAARVRRDAALRTRLRTYMDARLAELSPLPTLN